MASLIANPGLADEQTFELSPGVRSIGRTKENDVFVLHKSLSRKHAELQIDDGRLVVTDLQSKNGTWVNGVRVERAELKPGDLLKCGDVVFRFGEPAPGLTGVPTLVFDPSSQLSQSTMAELVGAKSSRSAIRVTEEDGAERARAKLRILLKVGELLSAPHPIDRLLERILDLVFQILDVDRGAIIMVDNGQLVPRVLKSSGAAPAAGRFYSEHIVRYVFEKGMAALFTDAKVDPRLGAAQSILSQSICASMCAPLKRSDAMLGVLYVDNLRVVNRFTEEDLEFLTAFASQAAIAIENATLYKRIEEEAVLRSTYLRFFPPATVKRMRESSSATLEAVETDVTALFTDISGFTEMSAKMSPREVVDLLNEYFPVMSEIVFRHEGTLEKYIGDALMAVWGAPFSRDDDADRALAAAAEMQIATKDLNARLRARGMAQIKIHVGANTGRVAAGNIGSDLYLQYATIGDATNVASRVCGVAQPDEILATQATVARLRAKRWPLEELPAVTVKGKDTPLMLYRVRWDAESP